MKTNFILTLVVTCLLTFQCSKEIDNKTGDSATCSDIFSEISKPVTDGGKGWILFSWEENNQWKYSLVANLNISPANERVSEKNIMRSDSCLKYNLGFFAEDVDLFWYGQGKQKILGTEIELAFPSSNILHDIQQFCEQKKLVLNY